MKYNNNLQSFIGAFKYSDGIPYFMKVYKTSKGRYFVQESAKSTSLTEIEEGSFKIIE